MIWWFGIVLFFIELYILKHTEYYLKYYDGDCLIADADRIYKPISIKVWQIILLAISNLPFIWICSLLVFAGLYVCKIADVLGEGDFFWRINIPYLTNFLNKEI